MAALLPTFECVAAPIPAPAAPPSVAPVNVPQLATPDTNDKPKSTRKIGLFQTVVMEPFLKKLVRQSASSVPVKKALFFQGKLERIRQICMKKSSSENFLPGSRRDQKHLFKCRVRGTGLRVVIVGENYEEKLLQKTRANRFSVPLMRFLLVVRPQIRGNLNFYLDIGTGHVHCSMNS
jgi:hypothetical protein